MTTDGPSGLRLADPSPPAAPQLLDVCDRLLGEVGRRRHLFGWLRTPDSEHWLAVDAYYPGNRLVVVCRDGEAAGDDLIGARVPEHGLRLLWLAPAALLADPVGVVAALERELGALGPAPARPRPATTHPGPSPVAKAVASLAQPHHPEAHHRVRPSQAEAVARATRFVAAHPNSATRRPTRPMPLAPRRRSDRPRSVPRRRKREPAPRLGAVVAVALAVVVAAEVYFAVIRWALDGGHVLLAFGLALDTCARGLGTVAAGRAGDRAAAWYCALGGSPFVAGFALYGPDGPVEVDPAPLAGLLALFAGIVLAVAIVAAALGG